jgi:hypothetical protein
MLFIGVVIRYFLQKKTSIKVLVVVIAMGFIGLTKSQLHQYSVGLLHWDSMTWPAYRAIFLNSKLPANYEKLLVTPDYEKAKKGMRD